MKNVILFSTFVLFTFTSSFAQSPEECTEYTTKNASVNYKYEYFNMKGVNLNHYDWTNPTTNCHINKSALLLGKSIKNRTLGSVAVGAGIGLALSSIGFLASPFGGNVGAGVGLLVPGVLCIGGSVPLFLKAKKQRRESNEHFIVVSDYFQKNKIY